MKRIPILVNGTQHNVEAEFTTDDGTCLGLGLLHITITDGDSSINLQFSAYAIKKMQQVLVDYIRERNEDL